MSSTADHVAEMARIRARIARTDPADVRERVLLVCAHERARRRVEKQIMAAPRSSPAPRVGRDRTDEIRWYSLLVPRVRTVADRVLAPDATVLVVSKGDDALLELGGRVTGHFPQTRGKWAGFYPETADEAVAQLDELHAGGWEFIVFPATAFWWLEYYERLASRLLAGGRVIWHDSDCAIIALGTDREKRSI